MRIPKSLLPGTPKYFFLGERRMRGLSVSWGFVPSDAPFWEKSEMLAPVHLHPCNGLSLLAPRLAMLSDDLNTNRKAFASPLDLPLEPPCRTPQIPRPIVGGEPVIYRTCTPPSVKTPPSPTSNYVALDEVCVY